MANCKITYCGSWNYRPRAASLAEDLKKEFGFDIELVQSSGGIFDVEYGGKIIFSKKEVGRFPDLGEVPKIIKKIQD